MATCYVCGQTSFVERVADLPSAFSHSPEPMNRVVRLGKSPQTRAKDAYLKAEGRVR